MTAQIGDSFKFDGQDYTIVALSEYIRFDPREYGITPEAACTACWAGYWCAYNIKEDGIYLEDLYINSKDDYYPEILGVNPVSEEETGNKFSYMGHHLYKGINLKMPYTGKLLVGKDFMHEYYIHMGYQRAWAYKTLIELVFESGVLIEKNDQSDIAEQIRKKIKNEQRFEKKLRRNIPRFVDESFSLDYGIKAWWLR